MEILLEIFFEIYVELMMYIIPEEKASSKKYRIMVALIALLALFGVIALFVWGLVLIVNHNNKMGLIPMFLAIILSIIQIVAGFILHNNKSEENTEIKRENDSMPLNLSQIQAITLGAARVEQHEDGVHFYRFTRQQEELYKERNEDFYIKTFSTSGVRLRFRTNSQRLCLRAKVGMGCSRSYFSFDVFVDGKMVDSLNNFTGGELPHDYTKLPFLIGNFSKEFDLGAGEKEVCIYFPWSVKVALEALELDDGAFADPVKPTKKMLCFGDSITHGYDALHPSNKYISKLADFLDAEEYNKAIGGEIFWPGLAATREDFDPDYITVAYGTNDWNNCSREEFEDNCQAFYRNLRMNYPNTPIYAITPIWRKDMAEARPFGAFRDVDALIRTAVAGLDHISVIDGFTFVPRDERLYADLRLHPNDEGFAAYFEGLKYKIVNCCD